VDFVGRVDPVRKLKAWLSGDGLRSPASIVSVSGPGGIGKTVLLEHAIRTSSVDGRNYLRLTLAGSAAPRTLGQIICHDLLQSCTQLDPTGKDYFIETRRNLEALRFIDDQARHEVEATMAGNAELRQTVFELFRLGAGLQAALPVLKKYVDLTKVKEQHLASVLALLEKAEAFRQERRLLGGALPDVLGRGRRNRLRAAPETAIADGLVADLSAVLSGWRATDAATPMPSKVPRLDRLLLVIDDFESLADTLNPFLGESLVPMLARASFESLVVVLGRDRLSDTDPMWRQRHDGKIVGELRLEPFTREEAEAFVRSRGVSDDATVARILDETAGYPYLVAGEVEAELDGGRTALGLKAFYDRTTRWMTGSQQGWLVPLCFLDEINEETIAAILPDDDPNRVLEWFKGEASVRSPMANRWEVLPIIRSRICAYLELDSPRRHRELRERAARARGAVDERPTT
jgi:hypothetical protein